MGLAIMQIVAHASGIPTDWDGQYVVEYHPRRKAPNFIGCYIVTTPDRAKARRFATMDAAEAYRMTARGQLPSGKQDRPLAAFTVTVLEVPS
jgi:hypothetical protein